MGAAVRDLELAINWRVTLLGLNVAAWLVAALAVAGLFMHRDITGEPSPTPGFGYSIPMFDDFRLIYSAKTESEPVVGLKRVGGLSQEGAELGPAARQTHGRGFARTGRLEPPDTAPAESPHPIGK